MPNPPSPLRSTISTIRRGGHATRGAAVGALLLAFATVVPGCAATTTTPRMRVARDLGCTAERTTVERVDPASHRWNVSGCGRHAVYVCTEPVRDCWREGDVHANAP